MSDFLREISAKIGLEVDTRGLDQFNHKLEGMHRSLEVIAGAEIIRGLFEIAEKFSGMGEQLETAASSAGITTDAFQRLSFAAAQSGVGQDKLGFSLNMLSRQLAAAREGSEGAANSFEKIGISPEQLASFSDSGEALKAVADRISAIQDPIKRTRAAMQIFGRGGAQMVRFMSKGAEGINEEMSRAGDMGAVVSSKQIEQLVELEEAMSALGAVIKAAFATLATYAAPIIKAVVGDLEKLWQANRAIIETKIGKWFRDLAYAVGFTVGVVSGLTNGLILFINTFPRLSNAIGEVAKDLVLFSAAWSVGGGVLRLFKESFVALTGVLGIGKAAFGVATQFAGAFFSVLGMGKTVIAELVFSLGGLIGKTFPLLGAAFERLGLAMATTPIGLVVAALGALVVASHDLWVLWNGGDFWKDTWLGQGLAAIAAFTKDGYKGLTGKTFQVTMTPDELKADKANRAKLEEDRAASYATVGQRFAHMVPFMDVAPNVMGLTNLAGANNPLYDTNNSAVTLQNTFNITAAPGMDAVQLATLIGNEIDKKTNQAHQQAKDGLLKARLM